jgi:hypothetical protein
MESNLFLEKGNTVKRLIGTFVLMVVVVAVVGLACCGGDSSSEPKPVTEVKDFAYVHTQIYTQNRESVVDGITTLNQWLRANPSKKVVSFAGILAYREGVSGYVIYFVSGDNSKQKFERIDRSDFASRQRDATDFGIHSLQTWRDANSNARIVAIAIVPAYSGGVREFTICYEQ